MIKNGPNKGRKTSAAGVYQFLERTWRIYKAKLGLKDFSPTSQDRAALALAKDAYRAKRGKDLTTALLDGTDESIGDVGVALSGTWTSLPSGIEKQLSVRNFVQRYRAELAA